MSHGSTPRRPAPVRTEDNHAFWDAADEGRLVAQRCESCGVLLHPPRVLCPRCGGGHFSSNELTGIGTLYSYAFLHHPQHPAFDYPVLAALVDLDEGVRVLSNLVDIPADDVRIGMRLRVEFAPVNGGGQIPVFAPATESER